MANLFVLGSCGAYPEPNRACSGFLLEYEGFRVVIDLGFGTATRLFSLCSASAVDAVVITHEHSDHCVDLNALFRARVYFTPRPGLIPLYCTPGVVKRLTSVEPSPPLTEAFTIYELPGSYDLGPLQLTGVPLPHHVPNSGIRITAPGIVLSYTGDSGPTPALAELGHRADLFIVEATLQGDPADPPYLTTASEAGRWATLAGAKQLMLTHFWPGSDRASFVADAKAEFSGPVHAANEGMVIVF